MNWTPHYQWLGDNTYTGQYNADVSTQMLPEGIEWGVFLGGLTAQKHTPRSYF
jgi:hypothetical protein